jgi:DUF971 family protein
MSELPLLKKIWQKDNHRFCIEWSNGRIFDYKLSELQAHCPCAACNSKQLPIQSDVRAIKISSIGLYALKIQYTQGCSNGIYSYALLYQCGLNQLGE